MGNGSLIHTAKKVVGKAILAADESTETIRKRLATIGVDSTPEINRQYRQLLFTATGIEKYISGVILYDETIRQTSDDGIPFPKLLSGKGIVPGIKVDKGAVKIPGKNSDTFTQGLDGLGKRLTEYKELGACFAKWRAVYTIADDGPSLIAIERNAHDLALYALICQDVGIVPIIEPEVLMDGDHSFEKNKQLTIKILTAVFVQARKYSVDLSGVILKPNMITAGKNNSRQKNIGTVAETTLQVLNKVVPAEVAGVAFLSGGQSPPLATDHLNMINKIRNRLKKSYPGKITASYGRALQGETLEAWAGKKENVTKAQRVFISRAEKVYKAGLGQL
ncbi:fructose-bisphosphate aldolase class I [Candidatus Roizmanbacteria bacterium]|nr:fructose-bisphosphate aldolase class I [Candidatus Roizmanbacteria bacterium]